MMMSICRNDSSSSLTSLPPSLHQDFFQAFHRTTCLQNQPPLSPSRCSSPPPQLPPPPSSTDDLPRMSNTQYSSFSPAAGTIAGDWSSGDPRYEDVDVGLMSCTESLGFESSDEISSLDYGREFSCSRSSCSCSHTEDSSTLSSSSSSSFYSPSFSPSSSSSSAPRKKWSEYRSEKREFPPPLTTVSENGRRSFFLRPERKDGRLEIIKVAIGRPEILYTSRQNGRLTMHLVSSLPVEPQYDDVFEEEYEYETEEEEEERELVEEEERESVANDFVEEEYEAEEEELEPSVANDVVEEEEEEEEERERTAEETEEEEREWKIPAAGARRCYPCHNDHIHVQVWGRQQQQGRLVTTM